MYLRFYEFIVIFLFFILFLSMLLVESMSIFDGNRPNFFYESHVKNTLVPKLSQMNDPQEIFDLAMAENQDTQIFIWRQVVFMSFFISFITMMVMKIFYLDFPWSAFILLFLCIFFTSFLLLCLITYHYYNNKSQFIQQCLEKYTSLK